LLFCLGSFVKVLRPLLGFSKAILFCEPLLDYCSVWELFLRRFKIIGGNLGKLLRIETLNWSVGV
jgi:hypothetical protein